MKNVALENHRWLWRGVLIVSALLFLVRLGFGPFFNPDEGRYASASLEMLRGFEGKAPDWVVPHLNTVPRLNKPPLIYWTAAASMQSLGVSESAGRLPSALAAIGTMLLVWWLGRAMFGARAGMFGAVVWASATFPFAFARVLNTDMLLCFSIALATCGVWRVVSVPKPEIGAEKRRLSNIELGSGSSLAGVGMGLALLSKGPVGVLFPLGIAFVWMLGAKQFGRVLRQGRVWIALLVALGIAAAMAWPWLSAIEARVPGFLRRFLLEENLGRFSGSEEFHKPKPFWFYAPYLFLGLVPWSIWIFAGKMPPASTCTVLQDAVPNDAVTPAQQIEIERALWEKRALWFVWSWAIVVVGVFSVSGTKLVSYILPAFPALAILVGRAFAVREEINDSKRALPAFDAVWKWAIGLSAGINCVLAILLFWYLTTGKTMPRDEGLRFSAVSGTICLIGVALLLLAAKKRSVRGVFLAQWGTACVLHMAILSGALQVARYEDGGAMIRALSTHLKSDDRVVFHRTFLPAGVFYAGRPVYFTRFRNNSGLEQTALRASKWYPEADETLLRDWAKASQRTFIMARFNNQALPILQANWKLIARSNDYFLFSNQDAPTGFSYRYVAPRKEKR